MTKREHKMDEKPRRTYNVTDLKIFLSIDSEEFVFCIKDHKIFEKFLALIDE